jgi:predicted ABC-type ATPase
MGGHSVPEETVRRRYEAGLRNFFHLYLPLTTSWRIYDNSDVADMRLIAAGARTVVLHLADATAWHTVYEKYTHGR